jgi:hypothetical protein
MQKNAVSSGINLKRKIAKKALAVRWWRTCKELGVPMPDDRARLKDTGFTLNPDQNNDGRNSRDRGCRVHGDAQLAVVRIAVDRVDVSHLNDGQQRQQNQTHKSGCPESTRLPAAVFAHLRLKSSQLGVPNLKDTFHWTHHKGQRLRILLGFSSLDPALAV